MRMRTPTDASYLIAVCGSPFPVHTCPGYPLARLFLLFRSSSHKIQIPLGTGTLDRKAFLQAAAGPARDPHHPDAGRPICHRLVKNTDIQES